MNPQTSSLPRPQPRGRRNSLTLLAIFSPFLLAILLAFVVLLGLVGVCGVVLLVGTETRELRRGHFMDEWLLAKPLSEFPHDLVQGEVRYFWTPGDVGPEQNTAIVEIPVNDAKDLKACVDWLTGQGFLVRHGTASDVEMETTTGRKAEVSHGKSGKGARIIIHVTTPVWIEL